MAKVKKPISPKKAEKDTARKEKPALNDRQILFCEEYLVDLNATQAAIRAGYSRKTARAIGSENLTKPDIRKCIDQKLQEHSLGREETIKLLSDIAQGSLNDYFVVTKKVEAPKVQSSLKQLIKELQEKIEDQRKLIARANIANADTLTALQGQEDTWRIQIIQYEIELERNPNAYRIVAGESRLVETVELDLAKLVKDKERGKIKSITPNEHGLKIEMYAADAALRDIGRVHGIFEKDNGQKDGVTVNQPLNDSQVDRIINSLRENKGT
jgi:phage terminase small subunit